MIRKIIVLLVLSCSLYGINPEEIIKKVDENNTFSTFRGEGSIIIENSYGKRESTYTAYSMGSDNTLIEFTSGEEEGQKILKTKKDLYIKYPYAEEVQRLSRSKTLGAISYDEMSGERNTLDDYSVEVKGEEKVNGVDTYVIRMIAKNSKVPHYMQDVYVDKKNFIILKALYYSKSGKLSKEMIVLETKSLGTRIVPVHTLITDKLKKNNSTENILDKMEVDISLDPKLFSLSELSW